MGPGDDIEYVTEHVFRKEMTDMDIQKNSFLSIDQLAKQVRNAPKEEKAQATRTSEGLSFGQIFSQKSIEENGLKFSKHASFRLSDRGIEMTQGQVSRLNEGARKAAEKGIKDSLVLVDDMAFIVNIPNQTVVTAMDSTETIENVFTHINGAVIM